MPANRENNYWGFWANNRVRISWLSALLLLLWVVFAELQPAKFPSWPWPLSLALIAAGLAMRSWAAGVVQKDAALAQGGPYALSRHPLYLGSLLILLGFFTSLGYAIAIVSVILYLLLYLPTIRNEERVLASRFPQSWPAYTQQTSWLWPKQWRSLSKLKQGGAWQASQWRFNREYQLLALVGGFTTLLLVWSLFSY